MLRRRARERFNHARRQRAGQDARRLPSLGQDVQALCEMSAPAGAVTSRREAQPERPLAEPLPAPSAAREWRILTMSLTPRCSGAAAQVRRLALAAADGAPGMRRRQSSEGHKPGGASAEAAAASPGDQAPRIRSRYRPAHRERNSASSSKPFTLNPESPFTLRRIRCSRCPGNPDHHQPEYAPIDRPRSTSCQ